MVEKQKWIKDSQRWMEISGIWTRWGELLKIANDNKLLRYAPAEVGRMRTNLQKYSLSRSQKLLEMGAVALCGFFLTDYPVITAAYSGKKELFKKYCFCTTKRDFN